jgi:hypothetical protein
LLFARDTKGVEAANRFEALVIQFLDCVERVSKACHPDQQQLIWLSKYGMLGLLRCRQHFLDYSYPHSLYERGIEGEGMVKELPPLCPNAVRAGWQLNLMNPYNRKNIVESLSSGIESVPTVGLPTSHQLDANGKRYLSWADVDHVILNCGPLSIVVLGTDEAWQCYVLVHMFRVSNSRKIILGGSKPEVDEEGFVYHKITLAEYQDVYDNDQSVMSFALMLPKTDQYG